MQTNSCSSFHNTKTKGLLFGVLLVVAGLLFLSFNFGWIDPALKPVIFSWPSIFIVIGIMGFPKGNYIVSLFWLFLGAFFLLPRVAAVYPGSIPGVDVDFAHTFWPLLLILFGIVSIVKVVTVKDRKRQRHHLRSAGTAEGINGRINKRIVFGGSESIFLDPVFHGGEIDAIFAGVVIDLRRTQLPEGETYLNVDAIFAGVELHIPDGWKVEAKFRTALGGFHDRRLALSTDNSRKLILQGDLIFGGCEVR